MSYKANDHRILTGSWNLLPPGDLVKDPDALWLENWRVDQAGALRSRRGLDPVPGPAEAGVVHTLWRRNEHRYFGSGVDLHRGTELIANGYDGQPIGAASFQGYAWFMHPSHQRKDNGAVCSDWLPAAPTTAPTVSAGAQQTVPITGFNQSEEGDWWNVFDPERQAQAPHWDTDNKVSGESSLWMPLDPAGTWYAERLVSKDLGIDGQQRNDDKCRIWINASDPAKLTQIDLFIDVNDASFDRDYYRVTITPDKLSPARWGWTCVEIYRKFDAQAALAANPEYSDLQRELKELEEQQTQRSGEGDYAWEQNRLDAIRDRLRQLAEEINGTVAFTRVGNNPAKDWSTVQAIRLQVVATDICDVNFDQWEFYGGVTGSIEGDAHYSITFDTDEGHETNPGPQSADLHLDKQSAQLTGIPISPSPEVTKRHIYRGGGTLNADYRVGTLNDNVTTAWQDRIADQDAIHGKMLEADRDGPPPAKGLVGPFFNKLLAFASEQHPNWSWWTKTNQPSCWPGAGIEEGNHEPVGEDGERILAMTLHKRLAVFYKERTIWRLIGDPDEEGATIEQTNANIGILGPGAVANAGSLDYFAAPQGVYAFDFDHERKISLKLDPIFKGQWTPLHDTWWVPPMSSDAAARARSVMAYANDLLYFSYPEEGQQWPNVTIIYDPDSQRWTSMRMAAALGGGFSAMHWEGEGTELVLGTADGNVYVHAYVWRDAGVAIPLRYLSGYQDHGLPNNEKLHEDLVIEHNTGGSTLQVKLLWDNGSVEQYLGGLNSTKRTPTTFQLNEGKGRRAINAAVLIDGEITSEVVIYAMYLHATPEPRLARSWDSGVFDCGTERVKEIDALEFDIDAPATVTWSLYGDMPGGALMERKPGFLAATGGRKTLYVSFALIEARHARLYLSSTAGFRLYGVRIRTRAIGEYIDGGAGEVWESTEMDYAT